MSRQTQMRIYTIHDGKMDLWLEGWKTGVVPVRRKLGFQITHAWVVPEHNQFIWVLSYDDAEGFAEMDAAYYVSAERKALDPDPAQYIAHTQHLFITSVIDQLID